MLTCDLTALWYRKTKEAKCKKYSVFFFFFGFRYPLNFLNFELVLGLKVVAILPLNLGFLAHTTIPISNSIKKIWMEWSQCCSHALFLGLKLEINQKKKKTLARLHHTLTSLDCCCSSLIICPTSVTCKIRSREKRAINATSLRRRISGGVGGCCNVDGSSEGWGAAVMPDLVGVGGH